MVCGEVVVKCGVGRGGVVVVNKDMVELVFVC